MVRLHPSGWTDRRGDLELALFTVWSYSWHASPTVPPVLRPLSGLDQPCQVRWATRPPFGNTCTMQIIAGSRGMFAVGSPHCSRPAQRTPGRGGGERGVPPCPAG